MPKRSLSLVTCAATVAGSAVLPLNTSTAIGQPLRRAHQPEDDLRIVALAVARMAARGQLAAAPRQPSRGQVVEHQRGPARCWRAKTPLDHRLRLMQPVQRPVQLIGTALTYPQHAGPASELAVSSCSKRWVASLEAGAITRATSMASSTRLQLLGRRREPLRGARAARCTQHGGHMAVGQGALDREDLSDRLATATPPRSSTFKPSISSRPGGQIGQGALATLPPSR